MKDMLVWAEVVLSSGLSLSQFQQVVTSSSRGTFFQFVDSIIRRKFNVLRIGRNGTSVVVNCVVSLFRNKIHLVLRCG